MYFSAQDEKLVVIYELAPPRPNLPPHELQSLRDLFEVTHGENWRWLNASFSGIPWNFSSNANPCADSWQGILCSQVPINGYKNVIALALNLRHLVGTLPSSLFNLTMLRAMQLSSNNLYGVFPHTVAQLVDIRIIDFSNNLLTGPIPDELGKLATLEAVYFYNNYLTGTLPPSLGYLPKLKVMKFGFNDLTGSVPPEFGNLCNATLLYLGRNHLNGTIPPELGQLVSVTTLQLNSNEFTGTIPPSLGSLQNLQALELQDNHLEGVIPLSIGNLLSLFVLSLSENDLTGTIPDSIVNLSRLQNLYLHHNILHGSIPAQIAVIQSLYAAELDNNHLTGTIPESLGSLPNLTVLILANNRITCTIPESLGTLTKLTTLLLGNNGLHGTIPDTLSMLSSCTNLYLQYNYLTGSIPADLGRLSTLIYLHLYGNYLTGSVPTSLSQATTLTSVFLQNNMFSGSLFGVFDPTAQRFLSGVDLSHNQLTGSLPSEVFLLPALQTFAVGTNCFSGSIPDIICNATTLTTLVLDGLRSGKHCQRLIMPGISSAYALFPGKHNRIPSCLFDMRHLNTLHLSGNGLTGSLSSHTNLSANLVDFAVSHNQLTGTVPPEFQMHSWYNLDLSFNKLGGTLDSNLPVFGSNVTTSYLVVSRDKFLNLSDEVEKPLIVPPPALTLQNNRLSGRVPHSVLDMLNISVLAGNIFGCQLDGSDLPQHDADRGTYQCGSNSFDYSSYAYAGALGLSLILVGTVLYRAGLLAQAYNLCIVQRPLQDVDSQISGAGAHYYKYVELLLRGVCKVACICAVFIVLVLLPAYAALSQFYGTHSVSYSWAVSGAYLSGTVPFTVLLVLYMLLTVLFVASFRDLLANLAVFLQQLSTESYEEIDGAQLQDPTRQEVTRYALICTVFFAANVFVVAGVNIAYIYIALSANATNVTIAQLALSGFKLVWNRYFTLQLVRWTEYLLVSSEMHSRSTASYFSVQLFVALFNLIAVPCIVVAAVSSDCFSNLMVTPSAVTSHYFYKECDAFSVHFGCLLFLPRLASSTYDPPFTYSYDCSSSLITFYAPTFMYMGLFATFGGPLLDYSRQRLYYHAKPGTVWYSWIKFITPPLLRYPPTAQADTSYSAEVPFFNAHFLVLTVMSYLGMLLTFGALFPPIAVVMLLSIFSKAAVAKCEVEAFLHATVEAGTPKLVEIIFNECRGVGLLDRLRACFRQLVVWCCLFYAPFLFDTLGDTVGVLGAFWVLLVLPLFPLCMYFIDKFIRSIVDFKPTVPVLDVRKSGACIELSTAVQVDEAADGALSTTQSALHIL